MHFKLHTIYTALTTVILILGLGVIPVEGQITAFNDVVDDGINLDVGDSDFGALVIDNAIMNRTLIGIGRTGAGVGVVNIINGGLLTADDVRIGVQTGSVGMAVIGVGSMFSVNDRTRIGIEGTGMVNITNGGVMNAGPRVDIGRRATAFGTVIVQGSGSTFTSLGEDLANNRAARIRFGLGLMDVNDGGQVLIDRLAHITDSTTGLRVQGGSSVNVRDPGSLIMIEGGRELLDVGDRGISSTLNITNGGQVILQNLPVPEGPPVGIMEGKAVGFVGRRPPTVFEPGSIGTVVVSGPGSLLDTGRLFSCGKSLFPTDPPDPANLTEGGAASVTVSDGGVIRADNIVIGLDCVVRGDGTLDVPGGKVIVEGILSPGNSPGTFTIINGDFILNGGTIKMEIDGTDPGQFDVVDVVNGNVILNSGTIEIRVGEVGSGDVSALTLIEVNAGTGTITIDPSVELIINDGEPQMLTVDESGNIGLMVSSVDIDIKPGSDPNAINLRSKGVIPVAILSSDTFDALAIDPSTVELEGAGVRAVGKKAKLLCHDQDVNGDGLLDLVCQGETQELGLEAGAIVAVLTAQTFDGVLVTGSDNVRIVP